MFAKLKDRVRRIYDNIGFEVPQIRISPEREQELVDKIVAASHRWGMEELVIILGSQLVPASAIFSTTVILPWAPLLEMIGLKGWEYTAFFENRENMKKVLERLRAETTR